MGTFSKLKNLYTLQKKAKGVKRDLRNTHIEAEYEGVMITLDGEFNVISVRILDEAKAATDKLEHRIEKALQKGLKKAQEIAGSKMKDVWGEMGVPGMS